ncbi:Putative ubiquitin-like-specific protease 1B [Apostasia shenzhenica]|uniref:Ubiquitin-like-specific protease 1B n=1 Tax=Apostasia shenzhenica TaxID=1088818 RepID=A0A2I0BFZ3_9ASPA|nr:Putative ubiquitin-like-specific protease 1B [Apostasia shenzhenica]
MRGLSLKMLKKITNPVLLRSDLLMVVLNRDSHWILVVLDLKAKQICIFDSIKNPAHKDVVFKLVEVLYQESESFQSFAISEWPVIYVELLPRQSSSSDCGVFVMKYMERLLDISDGEWSWRQYLNWQVEMNVFRAQIAYDIIKFGEQFAKEPAKDTKFCNI